MVYIADRYVEWVFEKQTVDGNFSNKIFFSAEAHFTLGWYANKQNCRIWSSGNSKLIQKVTVSCPLCYEGVIGSYFLENDDGANVTVNSERYGQTITDCF